MNSTRSGPIVLGYSPTEASDAAMNWAIGQAEVTNAEVILMHVITAGYELGIAAIQIDTQPLQMDVEARLAGDWSRPLRERGVPYRTKAPTGRIAEELMRVARAEAAALIVIGMTGRGTLSDLIFGSIHHDLVRHAVRPVVAVPPNGRTP